MADRCFSTMARLPSIDCVFLNAGVQRAHDWSRPESVSLDDFLNEMHVNYDSSVALTHAFLPHLSSKPKGEPSGII